MMRESDETTERRRPLSGMPKLLIATRNAGKMRELRRLLRGAPHEIVSLDDLGIEGEIEETGETFEENAALKAEGYCALSGLTTLADDSGLEVDALGGAPGVRSARYAGAQASDADRVALLLKNLEKTAAADRSARFRCVIAIAAPGERTRLYSGSCEGRVAAAPRGSNGFGYDPVFEFPELGMTMAELPPERKNAVSHRALAAKKAAAALAG